MKLIRDIGITVAGVFAAGLLMNAVRDNAVVKMAIKGYDA